MILRQTIAPIRKLAVLIAVTVAASFTTATAQTGHQEAPLVGPKKGRIHVLRIFNEKDLSGWSGHEKYWSVEDGEIVGRNTEPLAVSTYLVSKRNFSDFRLRFEFKLVQSEMHSGVAFWGTVDPEKGDEFAYSGHLVMFPSKYGFYELHGRKLIHRNEREAVQAGRQHEWNTIEILAQGNRIRLAINGLPVSDWRDPQPDGIKEGPIALQLHSNEESQEVRFRKLLLETFPDDRLVTLAEPEKRNSTGIKELVRRVPPDSKGHWTSLTEVVLPDELLEPIRKAGLKTMGIRADERDPYFAIIQKAKETEMKLLDKASRDFRDKRRELPKNAAWKSKPPEVFPSWVDLYQNPEEYHGKLLTIHGHIRKLIEVPQDKNPYGIENVYEAWLYDLNSQGHPTVILSTSIDPRLKTGTEVEIDHCFATGYFFKNMGYHAQDASRYAPVLIARKLEYLPSEEAGTLFRLGRNTQLQILLVGVIAVILGRHFWKLRKLTQSENLERAAVREIVDQNRAAPSFKSLDDDGGSPDFSGLAAVDAMADSEAQAVVNTPSDSETQESSPEKAAPNETVADGPTEDEMTADSPAEPAPSAETEFDSPENEAEPATKTGAEETTSTEETA